MLPPEEAIKVTAEIRAIAELRGEESDLFPLADLTQSGLHPPAAAAPSDDELSSEDLRDAWPLLDLEERSDGLRVLPREDAEDFFVSLPAADQAKLILHFRPGQRRQWMRLLEPDAQQRRDRLGVGTGGDKSLGAAAAKGGAGY